MIDKKQLESGEKIPHLQGNISVITQYNTQFLSPNVLEPMHPIVPVSTFIKEYIQKEFAVLNHIKSS